MMKRWRKELTEVEERYNVILKELEKEHTPIFTEGLESALGTLRNEIEKLNNMTIIEKIRF